MKLFFVENLITFHKRQKNTYFKLALLVAATIIADLRGNIPASRICLVLFVCFIAYILIFSIACMQHRKKHLRFKVYLSFSVVRTPEMVKYIDEYLKPAFWVFNIDYYDFREHKQFHYLNEGAICEEIGKNLADSDAFIRFIDYELQPNQIRLANSRNKPIIFNPYTLGFTGIPDYVKYEVDISFDKFGFTKPYNRFQIVPLGVMVSPRPHIKTILLNSYRSSLDEALNIISELSRGYKEQQYWKRSALFWQMKDEMMSGEGE